MLEAKQLIKVNWVSSKDALSDYVRRSYDEGKQDPAFTTRLRQTGISAMAFFYNLGHPMRGYTDFPETVGIEVSSGMGTLGFDQVEVDADGGGLLGQVAGHVERYLVGTLRPRLVGAFDGIDDTNHGQIGVDLLRILQESNTGRIVRMEMRFFDYGEGLTYSIEQIRDLTSRA